MAGPGWRLFLALPLPEPVGAELWQRLAVLRSRHPDVRWTPPRNYHATLVFLGATPQADVERIAAALRTVSAGWPPVHAAAGGVSGTTRRKGSGVAWLQIGTGRQALSDLSLRLHQALQGGTDASGHNPHVTLARRVDRPCWRNLAGRSPRLSWPGCSPASCSTAAIPPLWAHTTKSLPAQRWRAT